MSTLDFYFALSFFETKPRISANFPTATSDNLSLILDGWRFEFEFLFQTHFRLGDTDPIPIIHHDVIFPHAFR